MPITEEYDPSRSADTTAIASPPATPATSDEPLRPEGKRALISERTRADALEKEIATLKALVDDKERQRAQAQMTLEQKSQAEIEAIRQSMQAQVDAALAAEQAKYQAENEARTVAEQRLQMIENQQLASRITGEFASTFAPLLNDPNPLRLQSYMKLIEDDLTVDNQGNPALIVRRDDFGRPAELAPIEAAIGYFQNNFPTDFKPPASQKTGGGARNLATPNGTSSRQAAVKFESLAEINANPQKALAHMNEIIAGNFQLGDR
jgi:hypothetical protein